MGVGATRGVRRGEGRAGALLPRLSRIGQAALASRRRHDAIRPVSARRMAVRCCSFALMSPIFAAAREKVTRDFPNYPAPRKCIDAVEAAVDWFKQTLGAENFYLELQNHSIPEQAKVNRHLIPWAKEFGLRVSSSARCRRT
jgi:DNA polymerase III alpha subunit